MAQSVPLTAFIRAAEAIVSDLELACEEMGVMLYDPSNPEEALVTKKELIELWAKKIYLIAIQGGTC
jgi:hypothetical protein